MSALAHAGAADAPRKQASRDVTGTGEGGQAPTRIVVTYGFWIFLLSDIIMFAAIFAAYAVLSGELADGPAGREFFDLGNVAIETGCLLMSTFTSALAIVAAKQRKALFTQIALLATGLLGLAFLAIELKEFAGLLSDGYGPQRSAFLSAFFMLVGCHGAHVTIGLIWLGTMMAQLFTRGFRPNIDRRLFCFSLFWHALDIVWVALLTVVYLIGSTS